MTDKTSALSKLRALDDPRKESAFLALFAGAHSLIMIFRHKGGKVEPPSWGKYECELVPDWEDFYFRELVELGFMKPEKIRSGPALGMGDGKEWTFDEWNMQITEEGHAAREAYWVQCKAEVEAMQAARKARHAQP